jgi:hypothetical protein
MELLKHAYCWPEGVALYSLDWYLSWQPMQKKATLDGTFSADELEAIAQHMREYGK